MSTQSIREARFEELLATRMGRLTGIARSYADGQDFEDLLQEILLRIWRSLDRFEGRSTLDTWAYRVALNTALGWSRRRASRPKGAELGDELEARASRSGNDSGYAESKILESFVRSLGPADRAVFVLYLEDLGYRQIGEITGMTESHVGVRIHRLKKVFLERYVQ